MGRCDDYKHRTCAEVWGVMGNGVHGEHRRKSRLGDRRNRDSTSPLPEGAYLRLRGTTGGVAVQDGAPSQRNQGDHRGSGSSGGQGGSGMAAVAVAVWGDGVRDDGAGGVQ